MDPGTNKPGKGSAFLEDSHGHHRLLGEVIFINPESNPAKDPNDKWCNDIARAPWVQHAAGCETEEEGCGTADKDGNADVIDSHEFFADGAAVGFESEEEVNASNDNDDNGDVDVEDPAISSISAQSLPSPSRLFGDRASDDRANNSTKSPRQRNNPKKRASLIETKHISNCNFNQSNHSTSANSLNLIISFRKLDWGCMPLGIR